MMRFLADENFDNRILRGLRREGANVDIVRVQDSEIYQADDQTVLEYAAKEDRVLMTHGANTMPGYAYARVRQGQPMPGVVVVRLHAPLGVIIDDLLLLVGASKVGEAADQVILLPLN